MSVPFFPVHSFQLSPILRELARFAFNAVKYNVEYVTYSSDLSVYRFNLKVVLNLLKGTKMSEEQQQQIVERYMAEAEEMKERYNDAQRHSRAVLAAKLAARRRQKEEINKEAAMKKELKEMSKKQVIRVMFQTFLYYIFSNFVFWSFTIRKKQSLPCYYSETASVHQTDMRRCF